METIECGSCGAKAEALHIRGETQALKFVQVPAGWFAEIGLADTGHVACSQKCIDELIG